MTRINAIRNIVSTRDSVAWGKKITTIGSSTWGTINALVFAAVLIVCSVTVGCSSEQPKPASNNTQIPSMQTPPTPSAPAMLSENKAETKPAPKKAAHKKPATLNYSDKNTGVTFEYPRRYAIETGDAAAELLVTSPIPMNFVAPGGVALAAVELPESSYANTDFDSAFFNVSVHKGLTPEQCNEFAVPAPKVVATAIMSEKIAPETKPDVKQDVKQEASATPTEATKPAASIPAGAAKADAPSQTTTETAKTDTLSQACHPEDGTKCGLQDPTPVAITNGAEKAIPSGSAVTSTAPAPEPQGSKLLIGDMELRATEAVSGEGARQSDSKYFHVFQNGACYEFAMNVTTVASQEGLIKHVDRDKVFTRLGQILDTVKIDEIKPSPVSPEVTAVTPAATTAPATPAQ